MPSPERDPYLCAAGSFFFPGFGQVYCGRILRGIIFLVPAVIVTVLWYYPGAIWYYAAVGYSFSFTSHVVDFMVRVIATYGAYNIAKSASKMSLTKVLLMNNVVQVGDKNNCRRL